MHKRLMVGLAVLCVAILSMGTTLALSASKHSNNRHQPSKSVFFAVLKGKNEISATTGKKRAGDPDGLGSVTIQRSGNKLCFGITVDNLSDPTAAHIHKGTAGHNGPVVVTLNAPSTGAPGASSGCVDVDASLANAIQKNPHKYYVNVHTTDFPNGAVRGQLAREHR